MTPLCRCLQEAGLDDAGALAQASPYLVESGAFSWAVFLESLLLQLLMPLSLCLPFLSLPPSKAYLRLRNMVRTMSRKQPSRCEDVWRVNGAPFLFLCALTIWVCRLFFS